MSGPFRLGLVGAGAIARAYVAAIAGMPSVRLSGIADVDAAAAGALAAECGAATFTTHIGLADAGICDAVLVTTPPVTHAQIVVDIVSRGLSVLCEKPLSIDSASAARMIDAATRHGVVLSMASKFRFVDDVIAARKMIRDGAIGVPRMLENTFTGVVDMTGRWNSNPTVSGGGVLIDNGTHCADIIRYLLGPISKVHAVAAPRIQPLVVEDGVTLFARTESGAQATAETSWSIHKDRSSFIEIYGDEGTIEIGWRGSRRRNGRSGAWESFGTGYDKVAAFAGQIDHFTAVVRGEDRPLPNCADALASVSVIQAAYRSIASGAWASVADDMAPAAAGAAR
ncbi:MAG: Gfo/Idh/MocA family oxidoreductase [Rhodobacteraceae bacterium]|nr:Gfo/Idh/MocA family oxidoreductase [Paracoccaceae bacterium]